MKRGNGPKKRESQEYLVGKNALKKKERGPIRTKGNHDKWKKKGEGKDQKNGPTIHVGKEKKGRKSWQRREITCHVKERH